MSRNDDTIAQLRFLAENWHRFSTWTRLRITLTVLWYVKVRRPYLRFTRRLTDSHSGLLFWPAVLLLGISIALISRFPIQFNPYLVFLVTLASASFILMMGFATR